MEIEEQLTTAQILCLAQSSDYDAGVPDGIFSFFDEHFDFASWKWDINPIFGNIRIISIHQALITMMLFILMI